PEAAGRHPGDAPLHRERGGAPPARREEGPPVAGREPMRTPLAALAVLGLLAVAPAASCAAEELEASLKVSGRVVEVRVRQKDGRPAAGVPVRLLYGRQLTAAAATTDGQ